MDIKKAQFRIEHLTGALRYGLTIMVFGTANISIVFGTASGNAYFCGRKPSIIES